MGAGLSLQSFYTTYVPDLPLTAVSTGITPAITTTSLKQCHIFRAPVAGQISKVHARWNTVTGTNTATFALQDVNASGFPDGVDDQTAPTATPANGSFFTVTFSSNRTVAAGDLVAFVVGASAIGTTFQLTGISTYVESNSSWCGTYNGTSWSTVQTTPAMCVEYSDGSIYPIAGIHPGYRSNTNVSTSTSPSEVGTRLRLPFPCRVIGAIFNFSIGATAPFDVVLYSDGMTMLASGSRGNIRASGLNLCPCYFSSPYELAANTFYRLGIKPTSTTNVQPAYTDVSVNAHLAACPGGVDWTYWSRTGTGSLTDLTTRRLSASLIVDKFDSGGGAIGGGGLNGGLS